MQALRQELTNLQTETIYGRVKAIRGVLIEIAGPLQAFSIGSRLQIERDGTAPITVEIVGFRQDAALAMPYGNLEGVGMGAKAVLRRAGSAIKPNELWLGRIINALGEPIDGKGPLVDGDVAMPIRNSPPPPISAVASARRSILA